MDWYQDSPNPYDGSCYLSHEIESAPARSPSLQHRHVWILFSGYTAGKATFTADTGYPDIQRGALS